MMHKQMFQIIPSLSLLTLACSEAPANHESPIMEESSIINGAVVASDSQGLVRLQMGGGSCSGTLLTTKWILTAKHCTSGVAADGVTATLGTTNETSTSVVIVEHPTLDVSLVQLGVPFDSGSYTNNLWASSTAALLNETLTCYGYGRSTFNGGAGTLRTANLRVTSTSNDSYVLEPNNSSQIIWRGDSGGPCFIQENGTRVIAGVHSFCSVLGSTIQSCTDVSAAGVRAWVSQTVPRPEYDHYLADVNADNQADWIQVTRTSNNGWVGLATGAGNFQLWTNHDVNRGATNDYTHYFADVDGDHRADWIQVARASNNGWVGLATGAGNFQHWTNHDVNRGATNDYTHYFADVNGDGRADWIQVARTSNNGWVGLATGNGNFQHWTNHDGNRGATNAYTHYFADVNGDGRADWIQVAHASNDGYVGLATGYGGFYHWTNHDSNRGATNDYTHYFADVNGDGRADWIQVARTTNDGWVGLATGNGSFQHWTNHDVNRGATRDYEHYFADVNGDGSADWIQVSRTSNDGYVGLATGGGNFQHWTNHDSNRGATNQYKHYFADVNGDGCADWIQVSRTTNDGWIGLATGQGNFQHWTRHFTAIGVTD